MEAGQGEGGRGEVWEDLGSDLGGYDTPCKHHPTWVNSSFSSSQAFLCRPGPTTLISQRRQVGCGLGCPFLSRACGAVLGHLPSLLPVPSLSSLVQTALGLIYDPVLM